VLIRDNATGELVFERPMFLSVSGVARAELSLGEVYSHYRARFEVEHAYRFMYQRLRMGGFQSPDVHHQDTWLRTVQLAYWLIATASTEVGKPPCKPWQKYLPQNQPTPEQPQALTAHRPNGHLRHFFAPLTKHPFCPNSTKKARADPKEPKCPHANASPSCPRTPKKQKKQPPA
jgi:hypothetical protein